MQRLNLLNRLPLGAKLSLIIILAMLTLVMAVFFTFNRNIDKLAENTNRERLDDLSIQVQQDLQENIEEVNNAGLLAIQAPAIIEVTKGNNQFQAQVIGSSFGQTLNLQDTALIKETGEFLISGDEANNTEKLALIEASRQGDSQLEIIRFGEDNLLHIAFAGPLYSEGEYIGSVFGARRIDSNFFGSLSSNREIKYVLLYDGQIILFTFAELDEAQQFLRENTSSNDLAQVSLGKTIIGHDLAQNDQGIDFGVAYLPLQSSNNSATGTILVIRHEFQSIAEFQRTTISNTIIAVTILTIAVFAITLIYTRNLFAPPLARFEKQAQYIIDGNYSYRIDIQRQDEFGRIAALINQLTEAVQERENELNSLTHGLEAQIEETVLDLAQAYEQLQQRETYLKNIFANTNDAILILDVINHRILDANNKAYQMTHLTRDELLGMVFEDLHTEDRSIALQAFWERLAIEKSARTDKFQWQTKDLSAINVEISASLVNLDKAYHIIVLVHDITESKKAREQIQEQNEELNQAIIELALARQKALDMADLKSDFLATMSHELRTPLNAIIGYTEIQLAGMTGDLNQEQLDYQKRILENSEHLLNMINDLLDLSKIDAGRVEIRRIPVDLQELMNSLQAQMIGLAEEKNLDFEIHLNENMPAVIIGDMQRLKQILINLLSNAVKFTEKGSIKLEIKHKDDYNWQIIVIDTGIGIPSHAQEYVFDEFRQLDSSSRRQFSGTGLGLAIVKKLVMLMNGQIKLDSTLGEGAKFTINLPLLSKNDVSHNL